MPHSHDETPTSASASAAASASDMTAAAPSLVQPLPRETLEAQYGVEAARLLLERSWLEDPAFERLAFLRRQGIEPYPLVQGVQYPLTALRALETMEQQPVMVAGRLIRLELGDTSGRLLLTDSSDTLWLKLHPSLLAALDKEEPVGEEARVLPHLSPGDVVACSVLGRWPDVAIVSAMLLAPNLKPLPVDKRPGGGATLETLVWRASVLRELRRWFDGHRFVEVETPILAQHSGLEPHLDPFEARFRPSPAHAGKPVWLLTSPEYALKRTLVHGLERVFQLSRVFRNGEVGAFHNPEFTMLEWYRAYSDYRTIMEDCEGLIITLAERLGMGKRLTWQGYKVDLTPPWPRMTVCEAFREYAGIALEEAPDIERLRAAAEKAGIRLPAGIDWEEGYFRILIERVEPALGFGRPVFLTDYPAPFAALARVRPEPFPVAERFELYIAGVELGNAYSELNDPQKQAERFKEEQWQRARLGAPVFEPDPDYLRALSQGLPPTGGIAVGVDRLVMLLLDLPDIRHALGFPFPMAE